MPQIRVKTQDPFAVTAACDWSDANDVETLDVSEPDGDDFVTVTLYSIPETDHRFAKFAAFVLELGDDGNCPWSPAPLAGMDLSRILVENVGACWRANLEALPTLCYFGSDPAEAAQQLCDDFGISANRLYPGNSGKEGVLLVLVRPESAETCPDCRGSGKYHGFTVIEDCRRCAGSGRI